MGMNFSQVVPAFVNKIEVTGDFLEIGSERGDNSTPLFATLAKDRNKKLYSVDVDKDVTNDVGKETDTDMKLPSTTAETEVPTTKVVTLESLYNEIETLKADNLMLWKILILMTSDLEIIQTLLGLGNLKKKENK